MYDIKIRYLASVYLDADSLVPTTDLVAAIHKSLGDERFTPTTVLEDANGKKIARIGFVIPDIGWQLVLSGKRFDLSTQPTSMSGENMGVFSDFCKEAAIKLSSLLEFFERKARRMAVVREGLLPEMNSKLLNEIANRTFKLPKIYVENPPYEWDWRNVSSFTRKFSNKDELVNTIVTMKRLRGKMGITSDDESEFDRIRIDVDINTNQDVVLERFNLDDVKGFFDNAPVWHNEIEQEIIKHLMG